METINIMSGKRKALILKTVALSNKFETDETKTLTVGYYLSN